MAYMATIFFNFNLYKDNLVDDLLDSFLDTYIGYGNEQYFKLFRKLAMVESNPKERKGYFKEYRYPDIVLSEKLKNANNKYDTDYLGCYEYDSKLEKEGTISLFYNRIYYAATEYINDPERDHVCPVHLKDNIENLATIVLIHEFVHWIMLWIINEKGHMQETEGSTVNYLYFHEGFAQLLTLFVIERKPRKDLIQLFEWLAKKQSPEYRSYQELQNNGFDSIEKAVSFLNILAELDKPIDYWEACVGPNDSLKKAIGDKKGDPSAMTLFSRLRNNHKNIYCKVPDKSTDVAADLGAYGY